MAQQFGLDIPFWNHSKQHSSKTLLFRGGAGGGFGTIRNNTALKLEWLIIKESLGFGTIRNNTALKQLRVIDLVLGSFGTIRNNTALKHCVYIHRLV